MSIRKDSIVLVVVMLLLSACSGTTPRYSASSDNVIELRSLGSRNSSKVRLGNFTGDQKSTMCRLQTSITLPEEETFSGYIKGAFKNEFVIADIYDEDAAVELSGRLVGVEVDSVGTGTWNLEMEFTVSGKSPFTVKVSYPYRSAYAAYQACRNAMNALPMAVQELVHKVVQHPSFQGALKSS